MTFRSQRNLFSRSDRRPMVIAHRGGAGQWPGETIYAFEQATGAKVDVVEMDVHSTSDGVLVLMHNKTVDATTDGTGHIKNLPLAEIKKLDAGYRWTPDGVHFPFRGKGITVPTLKEVFENFPDTLMNIEIKQKQPSLAGSLCELIRAHGMTDKVLVVSFWSSALNEFRLACPEVATSASTPEAFEFYIKSQILKSTPPELNADALQVDSKFSRVNIITKDFVETAHRQNLQVHGWTVNDPEEMQRLIALGVDGIITDYPTPLLALY